MYKRLVVVLFVQLLSAIVAFADCSWVPVTSTSIMYTANCTKVGIGSTTWPADTLHLQDSGSPALRIERSGTTPLLTVLGTSNAVGTYLMSDTNSDDTASRASGAYRFRLGYSGAFIDSGSDVTINTTRTWAEVLKLTNISMSHTSKEHFNTFKMSVLPTTSLQAARLQIPFSRVAGLSMNVDWDGSTWSLDDTSYPGWFFAIDNRDTTDRMRIYRVSAGSNPRYSEDVLFTLANDGDLTVAGSLTANGGQDVAEWVSATAPMEPGTVVVLNAKSVDEVRPSFQAYDTSVAGVVSAQPGLVLGHAGTTKEMIATTGRVKVRVDATKRAIRVGDILVTSDKPGTAMVSEAIDVGGVKIHRPGTIVGKALEDMAGGEGEILVLLSLQ
jgi:hypothetical protein